MNYGSNDIEWKAGDIVIDTTFGGVIGDTYIQEDVPEIEVSDSMIFNYNIEEMNYEVIE